MSSCDQGEASRNEPESLAMDESVARRLGQPLISGTAPGKACNDCRTYSPKAKSKLAGYWLLSLLRCIRVDEWAAATLKFVLRRKRN